MKSDYAKFLLETPGLNFTLNLQNKVSGNQVGHFGIQLKSADEIITHKNRLEANGIRIQYEEINTTCCYALQDKFWIVDPDRNKWEFFYTKAHVEVNSENASSCCTSEPQVEKVEQCCSTAVQNKSIAKCCSLT